MRRRPVAGLLGHETKFAVLPAPTFGSLAPVPAAQPLRRSRLWGTFASCRRKLPGRIYLELGESFGTKVSGTFEAKVGK